MNNNDAPLQLNRLYEEFFERGLQYFFPFATFQPLGAAPPGPTETVEGNAATAVVRAPWLGAHYAVHNPVPFTAHDVRMLDSVRAVLTARYHMLRDAERHGLNVERFWGLPEDRYVSAFLDRQPYAEHVQVRPDRIAATIEVLRTSALTTYENRRISTGALLFGTAPDPCHALPASPPHPLRYATALTRARSFHRLSDGLTTLALVDPEGLFVDIIDVQQWSAPYETLPVPVPSPARYAAHSRATLCGGHLCLILTATGEMKIFADGVQVLRFLDGRWRITNAVEKYHRWQQGLRNAPFADLLFVTALNLAEERRGGLLVVLDDPHAVSRLISHSDLLTRRPARTLSLAMRPRINFIICCATRACSRCRRRFSRPLHASMGPSSWIPTRTCWPLARSSITPTWRSSIRTTSKAVGPRRPLRRPGSAGRSRLVKTG